MNKRAFFEKETSERKMNKKAEILVLETTIFIILNLVFFAVMVMFAYNSGSKDFIYEQVYAKQIVLVIDNAKPEMVVLLDAKDLIERAGKNKKNINETVKIDENENKVKLSLQKGGGYSYKYFSNNKINVSLRGDFLVIDVRKNEK